MVLVLYTDLTGRILKIMNLFLKPDGSKNKSGYDLIRSAIWSNKSGQTLDLLLKASHHDEE